MKTLMTWLTGAGLMATAAGCDAASAVAGAAAGAGALGSLMNVQLVNTSPDFPVDVTLFFHPDDDVLEGVLTSGELDSEQVDTTVPPAQTVSLAPQSCDDLQAVIIENADLQLFGSIGPSDDTPVFRGDGEDFNCGDTLVFTFSHADVTIPTDLNISFSVR